MIRYFLYFWTPPILTAAQEIEMGRLILLEGREKFMERTAPFREGIGGRQKLTNFGLRQWIVVAAFVALVIPALMVFWLPVLIATVLIGCYSGGSLLLSRHYHRQWTDQMIAKYATSVATKKG
ncbi:MAG: hypothetical protein ABSF87_06625 [Xanthobacteraceae bacterium]|jgi:hypothetical protein